MARKKLLTEGEIRQFMKLANLRPVGAGRLSEMGGYPGARDEDEELRDELDATEDELGAEDALADEEGDELDAMDDEVAMEDEGGGDMVSMDDFMTALERAIEEVTGEEADVSEEPGEEEEEVEMDAEIEMGPEGGEEVEMEMGEEDMVAEIVRRVQKRIQERRKPHMGARSDDPEAYKKGKFGVPDDDDDDDDDDKEDSMAHGAGAGRGEKPVRRSGAPKSASAAYRAQQNENMDAMANAIAERLADTLRQRRDRRAGLSDEQGKFGVPDDQDDESEVLPDDGSPTDPVRRDRDDPDKPYRPDKQNEAIVNEVAKRVAARLQMESRKAEMVDTLAERIMKRLTK